MKRLLILIFLTACAAPTGVQGGTPSPELVSPPAETAIPVPYFAPVLESPVLARGPEGSWYAGSVEPGAVIFVDGAYHLFFNGIVDWPAKVAVGHATSPDGITWTVDAAPLLDSAAGGFDGFTYFVSSVIQLEGGEWAMYLYQADEGRDASPGDILMATAPALTGPWSLSPEPIITRGAPGAWDASRAAQPSVLRVGDEYRMYFSGYAGDTLQAGRAIGLAASPDGYLWTKLPDPVLAPSDDPRAWDFRRVFQPRVIAVPEGFLMLYKSNISVGRAEGWGFASSLDGLAWSRSDTPVIDEYTYGVAWRRNGIADLIFVDGGLKLFLEILEREGGAYHHGNSAYYSNIYLFREK